MIRREDVYKIGKIGKLHGVKGEMTFMFSTTMSSTVLMRPISSSTLTASSFLSSSATTASVPTRRR